MWLDLDECATTAWRLREYVFNLILQNFNLRSRNGFIDIFEMWAI